MNRQYQKGISLLSLVVGAFTIICLLFLGMRIAPAYNERANVRNVINDLSQKEFDNESDASKQFDKSLSLSGVFIPEDHIEKSAITPRANKKYSFELKWKKDVEVVGTYVVTFNFEVKTEN